MTPSGAPQPKKFASGRPSLRHAFGGLLLQCDLRGAGTIRQDLEIALNPTSSRSRKDATFAAAGEHVGSC